MTPIFFQIHSTHMPSDRQLAVQGSRRHLPGGLGMGHHLLRRPRGIEAQRSRFAGLDADGLRRRLLPTHHRSLPLRRLQRRRPRRLPGRFRRSFDVVQRRHPDVGSRRRRFFRKPVGTVFDIFGLARARAHHFPENVINSKHKITKKNISMCN